MRPGILRFGLYTKKGAVASDLMKNSGASHLIAAAKPDSNGYAPALRVLADEWQVKRRQIGSAAQVEPGERWEAGYLN